jgi:hypothetical protein
MDAAGDLRRRYGSLNVFDAVHLGTAYTLNEPIVSTDTLYPDIVEVGHIDPRDLDRLLQRRATSESWPPLADAPTRRADCMIVMVLGLLSYEFAVNAPSHD